MYDYEEEYQDYTLEGKLLDGQETRNDNKTHDEFGYQVKVYSKNNQTEMVFCLDIIMSGFMKRSLSIPDKFVKDFVKDKCIEKARELINNNNFQRGVHYSCEIMDNNGNLKCRKKLSTEPN